MNLKDENAAFERYLDGVIKYGLRHANMKVEHFKALMQRVREMEAEITRLREENAKLTKEIEVWEENHDEYGGGQ